MVQGTINVQPPASTLDSFLAEIGEALGHPIRIAILRLVAQGETCLCEIRPLFPVDESGLSRHLAALRRAGLLVARREGVRVLYNLASPRVIDLLDAGEAVALNRADSLRGVIEGRRERAPTGE
jgi:DNA-binding transcriptional ArsR family regulator